MRLVGTQREQINELYRFYPKKMEKVITALDNDTLTFENFWDDARKITKRVVSDRAIKEWQIIFENVYDILSIVPIPTKDGIVIPPNAKYVLHLEEFSGKENPEYHGYLFTYGEIINDTEMKILEKGHEVTDEEQETYFKKKLNELFQNHKKDL